MRESRKPTDSEPEPSPCDKPPSVPLEPVVRLPGRNTYFPGKGCMCSASCRTDCICEGVDWTSREEHRFRDALEAIKADYEFCKDKPGFGDRAAAYYETVCAALQPNPGGQIAANTKGTVE